MARTKSGGKMQLETKKCQEFDVHAAPITTTNNTYRQACFGPAPSLGTHRSGTQKVQAREIFLHAILPGGLGSRTNSSKGGSKP